ncbi:SAM-dependent methyltransferase [Bradyrhizobium liaoningense]|nr:SAM-dependent methyltransferase [Bradyrhizobium liaoningense]
MESEGSMGRLLNIVTPLHTATKRDYMARMNDDKIACSLKAREYEADYWDGDRRFGYGGYRFIEGRWAPVAKALIDTYGLKDGSSVLDVGCGKGFLLYEMQKILPGLKVVGFDISRHGLEHAHERVKPYLFNYRAQDVYPYGDDSFDLVISLGTLHNLRLYELEAAVKEIERVGKNKYIMVEGYRNVAEMHNLECWALTAESILHTSEWIWLYGKLGYTGDYEFIYFE